MTECRGVAGVCDVAESCTGASVSCPADGYASAATECRVAVNACDEAESCTGSGVDCPVDQALDCDDGLGCTADSCDEIEGCVHTPIVPCSEVPTTSEWGLVLMVLLMTAAGALLLGQRRRFQG
jgi:hypothetical protein